MGRTKKVITQVVAIMLLLGILTVGVCGLYIGMDELDKPVSLKLDSVDNAFEVDGQRFYVRHDGIYDANGVLHVGFADESTNNKIETKGPSLEETGNRHRPFLCGERRQHHRAENRAVAFQGMGQRGHACLGHDAQLATRCAERQALSDESKYSYCI